MDQNVEIQLSKLYEFLNIRILNQLRYCCEFQCFNISELNSRNVCFYFEKLDQVYALFFSKKEDNFFFFQY